MLYLLDKNVRTPKWNGKPLHETTSAVVAEKVNGEFVLTVNYPITNSGVYKLFDEDMLIKAPVPVLGAQLFRIKKPIEYDEHIEIKAYHISEDVMYRSITPMSIDRKDCATALSQMVQNAKTDLGDFSFTSDITDRHTFNTDENATLYTILLDGKHSIVGTWEGELVRDNLAFTVKKNRGENRGVVITTHKNLKSYQRTKNSIDIVTRIHASSTFRAEGAEEDTTINVTVDSPIIGSYDYINEREYQNNDMKTVEELRQWAEAKFSNEGIDKSSDAITIEAYEIDGQVVNLGDTVNLKSWKHNIDVYKKAVSYEFDALTEKYISITFDDRPGFGEGSRSSGAIGVASAILDANEATQQTSIERAVKNANQAFDAEFEKQKIAINDGIEQAKAEAELYADNIKQSIDADVNAINTSMQAQSEAHDRQVTDILSKTKSVEELANQAKTDAASAITQALQSKDEAIAEAQRLDTVERQATETKLATAKSQAIAEATQLVNNAKTTLEIQIDSANKSIVDAKNALEKQISSVSTEITKTNDTIKTLATKTDIDATNQRVTTAETSITQQAGQIALKANQSTVDTLSGRVKNAETSITQQAGQIALKANQSTVDALTNRVTTAETSLTQQAGQIALKASQSEVDSVKSRLQNAESSLTIQASEIVSRVKASDFDQAKQRISTAESSITQLISDVSSKVSQADYNTLTGRVSNAESAITQNATEISKRLTSTQVEQAITNKGYATVAVLENKVKETADSFSRTISETKALIPTAIGATNYIRDFGFANDYTFYGNTSGWQFERIADSTARSGYLIKATCTRAGASGFHRVLRDLRGAEWQGRTMTYAVDVKASKAVRMRLGAEAFNKGYKVFDVTTDWQRFISTDTINFKTLYSFPFYTDSTQWQVGDVVYIRDPQLEDGNIATTPRIAEEDLKTDISSVKTTITQTASGVEQLSTSLSTTNGKVTTAETKISQLISDVSSKVSQADYNTLTGRVSSAETAITQNATEISKRLTSTQVESAITSKGYITSSALQPYALSTTVQNLVKETADSFSRTISETRALIPTSVGGKNYIRDFGFANDYTFYGNTSGWQFERIADSTARSGYLIKATCTRAGASGFHRVLRDLRGAEWQGRTMTYAVDVKASKAVRMRLGAEAFNKGYKVFDVTTDWQRFISTDTINFKTLYSFPFYTDSTQWQVGDVVYIRDPQLEDGAIATTPRIADEDLATVTALNNVTDTVDGHTRTIGAVGTSGSILDNVSKVTQTATGLVQEVSGANGLKTQVSTLAGSYAIKNLTNSGTVLNQLNLNKDGSVKIDGSLTQITGTTYIQDGVISSAKIADLDAGKITTGTLDAARIAVNSIDGSKLVFDQAFFNGLTANEAYLKQIFAKNAFITQVQAVTLSASNIAGGILTATNGAMEVNLNAGQILYYTDQAALKRVLNGYPTQFIKFGIGTQSTDNAFRLIGAGSSSSIGASIASFGTNRNNGENNLDGGFTGVNIYAGGTTGTNVVDRIELASDILQIAHAASTGIANDPRGWTFENQNSVNNNYVFRPNTRPNSAYKALIGTSATPVNELYIDEAYIKGQRLGWILKDIANRIGKTDGWAVNIS